MTRASAHASRVDLDAARPVPVADTRPFLWSIRRELWENRSITLGPFATAILVLLGFLVSAIRLPETMRGILAGDPTDIADAISRPYDIGAIAIIGTASLVGLFHALGALHGERRDRSLLFWKSLPVSDATAVLAKASISIIVLPLLALLLIVATQLILLLASTAILLANHVGIAPLWAHVPVLHRLPIIAWSIATLALWQAPLFAWALLVSAWARRMPILWAVLPPLGLCLFDRMAFGGWHVVDLLSDRIIGSFNAGITMKPVGKGDTEPHIALVRFLLNRALWTGFGITAVFLAGAVRLRHRAQPI